MNKATRLSDGFLGLPKKYRAEIRFGTVTDTFDSEGNIIYKQEVKRLEKVRLEKIINKFKGIIEQVVPMYSAVKHRGKPLYKFAREGVNIDKPPRKVEISGISIIQIKGSLLTVEVSCSSGTYIRTLAHDLGKEYGTGAVLSGLRRTSIDGLDVDSSARLEMFTGISGIDEIPEKSSWILSLQHLVKDIPSLYVKEKYIKPIKNGSRIRKEMLNSEPFSGKAAAAAAPYLKNIVTVRDMDGKILALHRIVEEAGPCGEWKPGKVFSKNVVIF
jgi:tRNA pseudouridine55 synthase